MRTKTKGCASFAISTPEAGVVILDVRAADGAWACTNLTVAEARQLASELNDEAEQAEHYAHRIRAGDLAVLDGGTVVRVLWAQVNDPRVTVRHLVAGGTRVQDERVSIELAKTLTKIEG